MNYEEKYNAALERAKKLQETCDSTAVLGWCEYIFPELKEKESEDDRIRKAILNYLTKMWGNCKDNVCGVHVEDAIAWLEKQGEQKTTDKVEPKFHEGEWITNGDYTWKIVDVKPLDYTLQSQDGNIVDDNISYVDKHFHLWTIQDAENKELKKIESKMLDADKVIKWIDEHVPTKFEDMANYIQQFKEDFGL